MTADIKPYIFFDFDGVLADFDRHATEQGKLTDDGKVKWDAIDEQWWITMPLCNGAREAYDFAKKLGTVKFLTAASLNACAFSGKAVWLQSFVPEEGKYILEDLIICPARDKQFLAKPDRILIDDNAKNIAQWIAAGGIGILHKGDFKATLKALELAVEKITVTKPAAFVAKKSGQAPRI